MHAFVALQLETAEKQKESSALAGCWLTSNPHTGCVTFSGQSYRVWCYCHHRKPSVVVVNVCAVSHRHSLSYIARSPRPWLHSHKCSFSSLPPPFSLLVSHNSVHKPNSKTHHGTVPTSLPQPLERLAPPPLLPAAAPGLSQLRLLEREPSRAGLGGQPPLALQDFAQEHCESCHPAH